MLAREIFHKGRKASTSKISNVLLDVAEYAQRFFPPRDAYDMLQTVLPQMDGGDLNSVIATQAFLVQFLPLDEPQAWLPAMFRLWETFKSSLFDDQMLDHLARLAEHQLLDAPAAAIDDAKPALWQETGLFTDAQFALIMTKCLRSAGLPVGANKAANATLMAQSANVRTGADALATSQTLRIKKPSDRLHSFAVILVYSMAPDAPPLDAHAEARAVDADAGAVHVAPQTTYLAGCKALDQLAKFVQATESYFHPSNWGVWQVQLANFVQHLTWEFARRCKEEERPDCTTPHVVRLTPAIKVEFVRTLRTVCLLSMFSKDPLTILAAQTSLKRMAYLQPELIVPAVLQRAYSSLETLETTHRTTSVISALSALAQPLVSRGLYAPGARHLVPLLHLCLPGIDLNDPMKTVSTCMFVLAVSMTVRFGDYSERDGGHSDDDDACAVDDDTHTTRGEEDYAVRLASADLDAWCTAFLQRILHLVDNLPDEGKSGKIGEKNEEMVLHTLVATCDVFCSALSPALFAHLLDEVLAYARTTVAASGVKVIGSLIGCFARADSAAVLARVVPVCCERIAVELAHGASSTRTTSTSVPLEQDTALHWHISMLNGALMFAGRNVLPHRTQLLDTCALLAERCYTERGYLLTAKLVQRLLFSLGTLYPAEQRSVNPSEWGTDACAADAYRAWGKLYTVAQVHIDWHNPSDDEIAFALEVLERVVAPALRALEAQLATPARDGVWYNDFCRRLLLVRYAYAALSALSEPRGAEAGAGEAADTLFPSDLGDEAQAFVPGPLPIACGYALRRGDARYDQLAAFADAFGDTLHRAAVDLHTTGAEDQIDAAKLLVRAIRTYLVQSGYHADELRGLAKSVTFFRTIGRTWPKQRAYPRVFWVRRAALYHLSRVRLAHAFARRTPRTDALTEQLVGLCLSNYVAIRKLAQSTLASVSVAYDGTRALCLAPILHTLRPGELDDRVKGALYVLANKGFARTVARNARFTRPVVLALLHIEHAKPSIQKLVRSLLNDAVAHLCEPAVRTAYVPTDALARSTAALGAIADTATRTPPAVCAAVADARSARAAAAEKEHAALVDEVYAVAIAPTTHWAFAIFALRALCALLRRDAPLDARLGVYFAREATSPNPIMRKHAQTALARLLYWIKLRTLAHGAALYTEQATHPLKHTEDAVVPLADAERAARIAALAEPLTPASRLRDKAAALPWLASGARDTWYAPPAEDVPPVVWEAASAAAVDGVRAALDGAWWRALGGYLAQEIERDYLSADTTSFVKTLAQMLGVGVLDDVAPLVDSLVAERDRHKHRAAAELVGGVIRGAKHWPLADQARLWRWCDAWMPRVLTTSTPDSQPSWQMCVEYVYKQRDPRRARSLLVFVVEHAASSLASARNSPLEQAHAQLLLAGALRSLEHKFDAWGADAVRARCFAHFGHDYQEVRKALAENLVELEYAHAVPAFASVDAFLDAGRTASGSLLAHDAGVKARCAQLSKELGVWRGERVPSALGTSLYDRAAMTGAVWVSLSLDDHRLGPMGTEVVALVPDLFAMYQLRDNPELAAIAKSVLIKVASYPFSAAQAVPLVRTLLALARDAHDSWHARLDALPLLQIVYFQKYVARTTDPACSTCHRTSSRRCSTCCSTCSPTGTSRCARWPRRRSRAWSGARSARSCTRCARALWRRSRRAPCRAAGHRTTTPSCWRCMRRCWAPRRSWPRSRTRCRRGCPTSCSTPSRRTRTTPCRSAPRCATAPPSSGARTRTRGPRTSASSATASRR